MQARPALSALFALALLAGCTGGAQAACSTSNGGLSCGGQYANKSGSQDVTFDNTNGKAMVNFGGQASSGTLTMTIYDASGHQMFQQTMSGAAQQGSNQETGSGTAGTWKVHLEFSHFTGQLGINVVPSGSSYCPPGVPYCK